MIGQSKGRKKAWERTKETEYEKVGQSHLANSRSACLSQEAFSESHPHDPFSGSPFSLSQAQHKACSWGKGNVGEANFEGENT